MAFEWTTIRAADFIEFNPRLSIKKNAIATKVEDNEEYIVKRLEREKRVGTVEKIDENTYRFSADVYDSSEMIPWIRTFICRIIKMNFSNRSVENQFKKDLEAMYWMYDVRREADE